MFLISLPLVLRKRNYIRTFLYSEVSLELYGETRLLPLSLLLSMILRFNAGRAAIFRYCAGVKIHVLSRKLGSRKNGICECAGSELGG